jgi:hypothetical protein
MVHGYVGLGTKDQTTKGKNKGVIYGTESLSKQAQTVGRLEATGADATVIAAEKKKLDDMIASTVKYKKLSKESAGHVKEFTSAVQERTRTEILSTKATEEAT